MDDFELVGPTGVNLNDFLKNYRDTLTNQYGSNVSALNQSKRNTEAQIMSNFNRRGTMYSNLPQREKIKNETNYLNNLADLRTTYQTGLDKLRNNAVDTYNNIKDLEDQIKDLQDYKADVESGKTSTSTGIEALAESLQQILGNNNDTKATTTDSEDSEDSEESTTTAQNPVSTKDAYDAAKDVLKKMGINFPDWEDRTEAVWTSPFSGTLRRYVNNKN